jgi:hypothetical protein
MRRNAIIKASSAERNRLEVLYDGAPIDDPNIIIIRIANTGKREIVAADYPDPMLIDFGRAKVINLESVGRTDIGFRMFWSEDNDKSKFLLAPLLLNEGESLELKFATDGELSEPKIDARFAGQSARIADMRRRRWKRTAIVGGVVALLWIALFIYMFAFVFPTLPGANEPVPPIAYPLTIATVALAGVSAILAGYVAIRGSRTLKLMLE